METHVWLASMLDCDSSTTAAVLEQYILNRGYSNQLGSGRSSRRADSIGTLPAQAPQLSVEVVHPRHNHPAVQLAPTQDAPRYMHGSSSMQRPNDGVTTHASQTHDSAPVSRHSGDATKKHKRVQYYFRVDRFEGRTDKAISRTLRDYDIC
eukprot:IDg5023t1